MRVRGTESGDPCWRAYVPTPCTDNQMEVQQEGKKDKGTSDFKQCRL